MIERIGRLDLEEKEEPADQLGPSRKILNYATKELESVHSKKVGNIGTIRSTR